MCFFPINVVALSNFKSLLKGGNNSDFLIKHLPPLELNYVLDCFGNDQSPYFLYYCTLLII